MRDGTAIIVQNLDGQTSKGVFSAVLTLEVQKGTVRFLDSQNFITFFFLRQF
jgi:hypothetical protein